MSVNSFNSRSTLKVGGKEYGSDQDHHGQNLDHDTGKEASRAQMREPAKRGANPGASEMAPDVEGS